MIVQELLFPNFDTCANYDMYFRMVGSRFMVTEGFEYWHADQDRYDPAADRRTYYAPEERAVHMESWQYLVFDTYFNSFPVAKWTRYTRLNNLKLQLELKGRFHVQVAHAYHMHSVPFTNAFTERICSAGERTVFEFDIPLKDMNRGMVCFRLDTLEEDGNVFYGGRYVTEVDASTLNDVDLAIDICTFRREAYIERNIALLNREIIENPASPVHGHLDVFISDNGKTLDIGRLSSDRVHIFPNKNVGGAGGFSRGMIEILNMQEKRRFSHALLMDDDVLINTDALVRTYRLLQFIRPEFAGKTVAGAMLRLDSRYIQHECGGWWDGSFVHPCKDNYDLTQLEHVLRNENDQSPTYNAWWYSCIPMTKISNANLPMPIFIRYDDVEYGLRTGSDIIDMSGICLWHEPFEYKYSSGMEYYHMRNALIVNSLHRPGFTGKDAANLLKGMIRSNLGRYRYKNCDLLLRAVEDFCKGPEFLFNTDAEALHKDLMASADKFRPLKELSVQFDELKYLKSLDAKERIRHKLVRYITLNKHLLPRRGYNVVDAALSNTKDFAGRRMVLNYDIGSNRGFITEYNRSKLIAAIKASRKMRRRLKAEYARVSEAYRQAQPKLTSREFWNRYLGL